MTAEAIARKFAAALLLHLEVWSTSHALGWIDARIPETNHDQTQYEDTLSPWEWVYLRARVRTTGSSFGVSCVIRGSPSPLGCDLQFG